jgi:hypothetical protein
MREPGGRRWRKKRIRDFVQFLHQNSKKLDALPETVAMWFDLLRAKLT